MAALALGGGWAYCQGAAAAGEPATTHVGTQPAATQPASGPAAAEEVPTTLPAGPDLPILPATSDGHTSGALWQMFASMLVILALGAVAIIFIKKVLPRFGLSAPTGGGGPVRGGQMRIIETMRLGQQRSVHLVEVQGRRYLLGNTQNGITLLAELPREPQKKEES